MRGQKIIIKNFRSFRNETIWLDDYTCLVGENGVGKSGVLNALNVFFRNRKDTTTDMAVLTAEDFHDRKVKQPIEILLTFVDLSEAAQKDFQHYYRNGELTITARAEWHQDQDGAEVKYRRKVGVGCFFRIFRGRITR